MASPCSSLHARGLCNSVFGDSWAEVAAALGRSPCGGNEPPRCRAWQVLNRRIVWDVCRVACKTTWDCDANGGAATSAPVGGGADTTVVHLAFAADAALLPAVGASITSAVASSRSSTRLHVHLMTTTASLPAAHALRRCLAASLAQHPRLAGGRLRLTVVDFETAAVRRGLARLLPSDENHQTAAAVEAQPSRRQALKSVRPYARRQALKSVLYARNLKARENFVRFYLADLLPAVERTLWLDADTIVRCDLSHLFAGAGAAPWHLEITRDCSRSPEITRDCVEGAAPWHLEEPVIAVALRDAASTETRRLNATIHHTLRQTAAAGSSAGPMGPLQREAMRQCVQHAGGAFNAGVSLLCFWAAGGDKSCINE